MRRNWYCYSLPYASRRLLRTSSKGNNSSDRTRPPLVARSLSSIVSAYKRWDFAHMLACRRTLVSSLSAPKSSPSISPRSVVVTLPLFNLTTAVPIRRELHPGLPFPGTPQPKGGSNIIDRRQERVVRTAGPKFVLVRASFLSGAFLSPLCVSVPSQRRRCLWVRAVCTLYRSQTAV